MKLSHVVAMASTLINVSGAQLLPIDVREATIASVHGSLFSGLTTCRDVVSAFLARIERFNPDISAVITLNSEALSIADSLDDALSRGNATTPLFCIPILLKDVSILLLVELHGVKTRVDGGIIDPRQSSSIKRSY
jgi:hypothetical protein